MVQCCVVWCAEGAVTRRQRPGCLATGTGKREGCVSYARAVCECVYHGGKRGYVLCGVVYHCNAVHRVAWIGWD